MRGHLTIVVGLIAAVAVPFAALGQEAGAKQAEPARTMPVRSFDRFEFDTAAVNGFWAEVGSVYDNTNIKPADVPGLDVKDLDRETSFARFAYGGNDKWEASLLVPYIHFDGKVNGSDTDHTGVGDIKLSGKYLPLHTKVFNAGVGAQLSLPSGNDNHGLGTGEFGALPFFTGAFNLALLEVRGHVGWEFLAGNHNNDQKADRLVYGFGIFMPLWDRIDLRNEFSGTQLDRPGKPKIVNYLIGLDVRLPIGDYDILLRPTGLIGVTDRAPDWGIGGSIVFTSPTFKAAQTGTMIGGVMIEE
jgi:hypothetical protein